MSDFHIADMTLQLPDLTAKSVNLILYIEKNLLNIVLAPRLLTATATLFATVNAALTPPYDRAIIPGILHFPEKILKLLPFRTDVRYL
ncbi:MAG: hypothetical protein R3E13_11290 [Alphaproteobacteria bacterium]